MKKAFTLIELLVVLAIISMLAAFLLPAISGARERARRTTCMNNLRQFSIAYEMYADDWYEKFPASPESLYDADEDDATPSIYPDYIKTPKTFWCPSSVRRNLPPPDGDIGEYNQDPPVYDPNSPWHYDWSDWKNDWYASYSFVFGLSTGNKSTKPVPMISDRGIYNDKINPVDYGLPSDTDVLTGNHPNGINVLYIDGSVNWVNLNEIVFAEENYTSVPDPFPTVACQKDGYSIVIDNDNEKSAWGED